MGLGNPGKKYEKTRHNIGFRVIDCLAQHYSVSLTSYTGKYWLGNCLRKENDCEIKLLLCKPLTYMNESGRAVERLVKNNLSAISELLIVVDDFSLPLGSMRIRGSGSSGGHNGLASIAERLATNRYQRLRLGIAGFEQGNFNQVDFVLGKFTAGENKKVKEQIVEATRLIDDWIKYGLEFCQNNYNCRAQQLPLEKREDLS